MPRAHDAHTPALLTLTCLCDVTAQAATWPMYEHLFERFAIHRRPQRGREERTEDMV